jgi:hypothetical protein
MFLLSIGIENIIRVKTPFNKFVLSLLFQRVSNFNSVKEQYTEVAPLTKKLILIGGKGPASGIRLPNTEIIVSNRSGLKKNWVIIAFAQDQGCTLIDEEFEAGRYTGFFTINWNLVNRCMGVLKSLLLIQEVDT